MPEAAQKARDMVEPHHDAFAALTLVVKWSETRLWDKAPKHGPCFGALFRTNSK